MFGIKCAAVRVSLILSYFRLSRPNGHCYICTYLMLPLYMSVWKNIRGTPRRICNRKIVCRTRTTHWFLVWSFSALRQISANFQFWSDDLACLVLMEIGSFRDTASGTVDARIFGHGHIFRILVHHGREHFVVTCFDACFHHASIPPSS